LPTFLHSRNTRIFWGGYDVTSYFSDYTATQKVDDVDTTTFTSASTPAKTFLLGFKEGEIKLNGLYDATATSGPDALLSTGLGNATATNLSICNASATWALADRGMSATLRETTYNVKGSVGSAVAIEAGGKADGGVDYTSCLHTTTTAETSSTNSTGVSFVTASTGAWAAYLHATACTGTATIAIKTGTDNVTFGATLTTFTGLTTAVTSEQKTGTSSTSWIYARVESTLASSPSYNYAVFLARR
jgi:hypothetical protein